MFPFDLREPVNALSHGAGMMMALPVTWFLWRQCAGSIRAASKSRCDTPSPCVMARGTVPRGSASAIQVPVSADLRHQPHVLLRGQRGLPRGPAPAASALSRFQRLDHVGIYLLIAGTYTPVVWSLLRGRWLWGTLATVWTIALVCAARVWCGGDAPDLGLDPDLPDDGLGVLVLLPATGADLFAPDAAAAAAGRAVLQHRRGDEPGALAGVESRGLRLARDCSISS